MQPPHMPVRRLHNYVYCPRLFYLQWVENIFVPNEDTIMGSALHKRVDDSSRLRAEALTEEGGTLRSLQLSSDGLGISGVVDILEKQEDGHICLLDYKKGSPAKGMSGEWVVKENDAIQLAAYALLLNEAGVKVDSAAIYYAQIKKRVYLELNESLFQNFYRYLKEARRISEIQDCPPPLCDARCLSCSAYPVCLPFESRFWASKKTEAVDLPPRAPMPDYDDGELLVVQNREASVGVQGGEIEVRLNGETVSKHPIHQLASVSLYGAIQISAQAQQLLLEHDIPLAWFSPAGRFIGLAHGLGSSGVEARMGQTHLWMSPERRLYIASAIVRAKIHNQRVLLMRNGNADNKVLTRLAELRDSAEQQSSLASLRGIEGSAASLYFAHFSSMLKVGLGFSFDGRNRRPPMDPVNALLSFAYSSLVKELTGIALSTGLDPFLGFFHSPRYGRPALALDMMEEFRPLIADSTVLSLLNRGEVAPEDFVLTARGVFLKDSARRQFWRAWTRRMDTAVSHPQFSYKMSYRRMLSVQMLQFRRFCRGDIQTYYPFTTR
ncbi:MAG: CRISPR-associated endonuclease Cas1 [Akkermansia sp.]|nr:CRISPR-associated endonuclease Cas1 [Akkermansia sp.]MBQ7024890.1 CRISPR-associated endonuclease Cas1 [Akkermansia sp.]